MSPITAPSLDMLALPGVSQSPFSSPWPHGCGGGGGKRGAPLPHRRFQCEHPWPRVLTSQWPWGQACKHSSAIQSKNLDWAPLWARLCSPGCWGDQGHKKRARPKDGAQFLEGSFSANKSRALSTQHVAMLGSALRRGLWFEEVDAVQRRGSGKALR